VLKVALILGGILGAIAATLMQEPKEEPALDEASMGFVDKAKFQLREAQAAARAEAAAKEAEMLAEYEGSRRGIKS
jgi:hypothetical protein